MRPSLLRRLGLLFRLGWWLRGIAAVVLMGGCAGAQPRKPCELDAHIRLTEEANAECHKFNLVDHKGNRLNDTSEAYGCGKIISNGTRSNVGHEVGHLIEKYCPEWAKGYFE